MDTWRKQKCPHCKKEIDHLEFTQDIIESRMMYYDEVTGGLECEKYAEDGGDDPDAFRCPECGETVATDPKAAERFVEWENDWPTIMDSIIDVIDRNTLMHLAEWRELPDVIKLVLYGGYFDSDKIQYILDYIDKPKLYCKWEISTCNIWYDLKITDRGPIYRGSDCTPPKNDRWQLIGSSELILYFNKDEVGVPQSWKENMRVRIGRTGKDEATVPVPTS